MSVPKVFLEAQEYRKKVLEPYLTEEEYEDYDEEDDEVESYSTASLYLTEEHRDIRSRTNYALVQLYEQKGYDVFARTCENMKHNNWFDKSEYGQFKGECAEAFLYVTIDAFIKKNNLPWRIYQSLVVPHRNGEQGATTEIDIVLVSEQQIVVFEAKSYNGNKTITDECTVHHGGKTTDIFGQNGLHCESLQKKILDLNINAYKGMKTAFFSYAVGSINDKRSPEMKTRMPALDERTIQLFLGALAKLETKYWRYDIFDRFDQLSKELTMKDHMRYVMSKRKG